MDSPFYDLRDLSGVHVYSVADLINWTAPAEIHQTYPKTTAVDERKYGRHDQHP